MLSKNPGLATHVHWTVKAAKVLHLWQPGQNYFLRANTGKPQILLKIYQEDKEGRGRKTTKKSHPNPHKNTALFPGNPREMAIPPHE